MPRPKALVASLMLAVLVALLAMALAGCEASFPLGARGEYGVIYGGYRMTDLDDPKESPAWLYPEYKAESRKLKAEMRRNVK